ncbi:MAG: HAMP domain-containing histidine kinase, partial [Candidatus Cloacimonetes bacterium]|nr:HAMP domain-containing histidine kinase [Candidatus Cloacimonadota bacterium]
EALEMELIKSNKLAEIGRRVEGIVHNINSPLNTILGYAQLIKKENKNQKDIEKIVEAGKNIAHTVKGLLNKVRMDKSSMVRSVNINELINQELELCMHNLFFKHHVDLEVDLSDKLLEVKAVYGDISLCLSNLINNAIESLENRSDKYISVRTYQKENMVAIEIDDSGEGIKKENLELIFEPYFTTKKSKNSKGSGFGLGLAISKSIAEKYGGYIQVESQINLGSTFIIFLQSKK